ncbi:MAG: hypothetical protein ACPLPX_01815 [Candidatus Kapaibacteriota bacterium]
MNTKLKIYLVLFVIALLSCSENTNNIITDKPDTTNSNFALILCEGLWGYNNSTISKLNLMNFEVENDFTSRNNKNFKIGDIGNDIALKGDTFFVVVTTSKALEYFNVRDGKLIDYITFGENSAPRHIAVINDSVVGITDLYKDCVYILNIRSKKIEKVIPVGPAPEFVEYHKGMLYVANSGYGDYRAKEPKAGTLSVVDLKSMQEVSNVYLAPNPIEIVLDTNRGKIFVSYNHLPSLKDSVGGIIMLDLKNLIRLKQWNIQSPRSLNLDFSTGDLYFLSNGKVMKLNVETDELIDLVINTKGNEVWYSFGLDTKNRYILIGNAKNYTVEGDLLIFEKVNSIFRLVKTIPVGVNPSEILIKN